MKHKDSYGKIASKLKNIPKQKLINNPTPIIRLDALEYNIGGHSGLYLKEEGFSGGLYGGNKIRNLEYLIQNAINKGVKMLVTFGSIESNFAKAVAIFGKEYNFNVKLYLCNLSKNPMCKLEENIERLKRLGAEVKLVSFAHCILLSRLANQKLLNHIFSPKDEYLIPLGGASTLGCLGHFGLAEEIKNQIVCGELPLIERMFVPLGSGGTVSGLIAGFKYFKLPIKVTGVYINDGISRKNIEKRSSKIISLVQGEKRKIDTNDILDLEKAYIGGGYGVTNDLSEKVKRDLYDIENILLDETYTAKSMAAFIDYAKANKSEEILFLQTSNCVNLSTVNYSLFEPYLND